MKNSRRGETRRAKPGANTCKTTPQNPMSTPQVSTSHDRIDIRIPKTSKTYRYLYVDNNGSRVPKWKQLDSLISLSEKARESVALWIFEDFLLRVDAIFPEKRRELDRLRPLILRKILKSEKLDDSYFEILKEL